MSSSAFTRYLTDAADGRVRAGCRLPSSKKCCVCIGKSISISTSGIFTSIWLKSIRSPSAIRGPSACCKPLDWSPKPSRNKHRRRRQRRPLPGMLLHIDGSEHQWFLDERWFDLIVILDDATSEIYYAQLVEAESTRSVMTGIRQVIQGKGIFCALYSDRASHFFLTPKAGEPVDRQALTQVGRALRELGIQLIPAYWPQARGRSERSFGTWQGRLPQELRIRQITTLEQANHFLRHEYIAEFNGRFSRAAEEEGTAFVPCQRTDLERIFSIQSERIVNRDNTVKFKNLFLQIDRQAWRGTLSGCRVVVYQHFDDTISIGFGAHTLGSYSSDGLPLKQPIIKRRKTTHSQSFSQTQTGHLIC